jgi:predicted nucleic acid-binding protein
LVGETILTELRRVLHSKLGIPKGRVEAFEAHLRKEATVIGAAQLPELHLRDSSDLPVLAEALSGKADVLVTGDKELLELGKEAPLPIHSPRGYWTLLRESDWPAVRGSRQGPSEPG